MQQQTTDASADIETGLLKPSEPDIMVSDVDASYKQ